MSDQPRSDTRLLAAVLPYARKDAWLYGLALLAAPVSAALSVAQPWLLKQVIDKHIVPKDVEGLQTAALYYLGAVFIAFVAEAGYTLAISWGAMRTITRLRSHVYAHSLGLAHTYHDRVPTGRLLTRATSDVEALGETLTAGAVTIVLDVMLVIGVLAAMFALDWRMTLMIIVLGPPLAMAVEGIRRVLRRLYQTVRTSLADLNAFMAERLNGVRVVQLHADEERTLALFDQRLYRYRDATIKTNVWDALMYALVDGLSSICMALMLWYGTGDLLHGVVTAGLLAAFIDYIGKLFTPIREFSAKVAVIQRATSALEKIFGLLDHDEVIDQGDREVPGELEEILLRDVAFAYGPDAPDVLTGVSLELRPGEVVALVGRTGSGKTTVGKLLTRMYAGYRGSISVNGVELSDLTRDSVRKTIGTVAQDVQIFPGDVRFNLALGADLSDEALLEAVRVVHAESAVERLGGLDGRVEHEGRNLSVGEAQLLAFARTMAHDPPVVILDEATASVDSMTEALIQQATEAILERKTVLVVAHRLSTIMHADRIAVMDAGRIAEVGTHGELMSQGGLYSDLFHAQFHRATEQPAASRAPSHTQAGEVCYRAESRGNMADPLENERIVVLSGAGLSKASGVPTFRDSDGLWQGHRFEDLATPEAWQRDRDRVRAFYDMRRVGCASVLPNPGHEALSRLQHALGAKRVTLVTQNVDGLIQKAAAVDVLEMHGSLWRLRCSADATHPRIGIYGEQDPNGTCSVCGAWMRPDIVWFGEVPEFLERIEQALVTCDIFVAVGTSGVVYPAAGFAAVARANGARCIEINPEPSGGLFDEVVPRPSEDALPDLISAWLDED